MTRWKRFRHQLEELGCRLLAWAIPRLSRAAAVRSGNALGSLAYRLDARGRNVALANLACAFGERFTVPQRQEIARASYRNFLRTMLDLFWAQRLTPENFREWMRIEGFDAIRERAAREGRGTVFVGLHHGSWEWAGLACGFLGFHSTVVAENFKNPRLTAVFSGLREVSGQTIIAQENSILRLLKIAKRRGSTGMLIDLNLPPTQAATVIEGFGMKMCVPLLHTVLAQRANALLVPLETQPQPDGTCRVIAHPAIEVPADATMPEIAQLCWEALEPVIRARPELYLWAYKHFRYRPRDAAREYPAYANESGKFEKLMKAMSSPTGPKRGGGADG